MDLIRVSIGGRLFDIPSDELSERTKERLAEISDGENIGVLELLQAFLEEAEIANTLQNALNTALARIDLNSSRQQNSHNLEENSIESNVEITRNCEPSSHFEQEKSNLDSIESSTNPSA